MSQSAYVLRIAPSGFDKAPEAIESDQIIIGWANAVGLLDGRLAWEAFREIIRQEYYSDDQNLRRAGAAAGNMWRFIREMKVGDLIVVPHWSEFYVAEVIGPATYDQSKIDDDTAYRRRVTWLNNKQPIPRSIARSPLLSRMKTQGTSADASDLIAEIRECLAVSMQASNPTFETDLQERLVRETLSELRAGRLNDYGFERLINSLLLKLGAKQARIVPRSQDKGADIVANFRIAGAFEQIVAVQAKHWGPYPPVGADVVEQLVRGMDAEGATLGMVITTGTISTEATKKAEQVFDEKSIRVELMDGEQFAKLIIESGLT
jgi:predicted Mrr-cat superfamily restriction endonuclease